MVDEFCIQNREVAILTKVNELAVRWQLKEYDIFVHLESDRRDDRRIWRLCYDKGPTEDDKRLRFVQMLKSVGIKNDDGIVEGSEKSLIDALDAALEVSPQPIKRRR